MYCMCNKKKSVPSVHYDESNVCKTYSKKQTLHPGRKMISDTSVDNMTIYSNSLISNLHYR